MKGHPLTLASLLAATAFALPQACQTTTKQVIVPTSTATYTTDPVTTISATTAQDLGTFTDIVRVSSTKTLQTITSTSINCSKNATHPTSTVYTSANASSSRSSNYARGLSLSPREQADCTVTKTSTTTYGQTYTFVPGTSTSTYTAYTAFTQATVTSTSSGFTAYAIATATTTTCPSSPAATTTQDSRCAPSALVSAAGANSSASPQFGLQSAQLTSSGATYATTATDGSACCQLCAEADQCAASSWDSRTGACTLSFPVSFDSGELSCGSGFLAFYDAGPNHPMQPGSGLFVAELCGSVQWANAKPDDGT